MLPARALFNDIAQRVLTFNKRQQRHHMRRWLRDIGAGRHGRVLDFGCGTALFARTLQAAGLDYCGYDPDADLVAFAASRYPDLPFVTTLVAAIVRGPFDLIVANCCFHHISDSELARTVLPSLAEMLRPDGRLLLIDVLPLEPGASAARRLFNLLEVGDRKRTVEEFEALLDPQFRIRARHTTRFHVLSLPNPVYNEIGCFELVPR